jgi:hypothetical protein
MHVVVCLLQYLQHRMCRTAWLVDPVDTMHRTAPPPCVDSNLQQVRLGLTALPLVMPVTTLQQEDTIGNPMLGLQITKVWCLSDVILFTLCCLYCIAAFVK